MPAFKDITGTRFGTLTVLKRGPDDNTGKNTRWWCKCVCGNETLLSRTALKSARSCGCLSVELSRINRTKHGHSRRGFMSREYQTWQGMNQRCDNLTDQWYGGRGIRVCERWRNGSDGRHGFDCFLSDMGPKPTGTEIDRIDTDGNYTPENCRWVPKSVNCNNKRTNVMLTINCETNTLAEWSRKLGISTYRVMRLPNAVLATAK